MPRHSTIFEILLNYYPILLLKIMICGKLSLGPKPENVKDRYTNVIKLKQHLHDINKLGKSAWSLASLEPVRVRKANFKA